MAAGTERKRAARCLGRSGLARPLLNFVHSSQATTESKDSLMRIVRNVIFYFALAVLLLWWGTPLVLAVKELEVVDKSLVESYKAWGVLVVPFAILLTMVRTFKREDTIADENRKGCLTVGAAFFFAFIQAAILLFSLACGYTGAEPLYVNKQQPSSGIYVRDFGCGATDTGPPSTSTVRIDTVNRFFMRITDVDTAKLDKAAWLPYRWTRRPPGDTSLVLWPGN